MDRDAASAFRVLAPTPNHLLPQRCFHLQEGSALSVEHRYHPDPILEEVSWWECLEGTCSALWALGMIRSFRCSLWGGSGQPRCSFSEGWPMFWHPTGAYGPTSYDRLMFCHESVSRCCFYLVFCDHLSLDFVLTKMRLCPASTSNQANNPDTNDNIAEGWCAAAYTLPIGFGFRTRQVRFSERLTRFC